MPQTSATTEKLGKIVKEAVRLKLFVLDAGQEMPLLRQAQLLADLDAVLQGLLDAQDSLQGRADGEDNLPPGLVGLRSPDAILGNLRGDGVAA